MIYDEMSKEQLIDELLRLQKYIDIKEDSTDISDFYGSKTTTISIIKEWELIFDSLPDMIAIIDKNHTIRRVNKVMAERLNVQPKDLVGQHCYGLVHGTNQPIDTCPHQLLIRDLKPHEAEFEIEKLDGFFIVKVTPILDGQGDLIGSLHVIQDITERKRLGNLRSRLASIVEYSEDPIIGEDLNGTITSWNPAAEKMYGYSEEEMIGKSISQIIPQDQTDDLTYILDKIKKGEYIKHYETIRQRKDGKIIDVALTISPLFSSDKIVGASIIARDITLRKRLERELIESEEKYREVFNRASDMISLNQMGEDGFPGKFLDVNKVGIERLGYTLEEFLNLTPIDIIAPEKLSNIKENASRLAEKGSAEFEIIHVTKDGKRVPVEVNNHIFLHKGMKLAIAISRDISERKEAEKALKESERKYRKIFENVQDIFYQTDLNGLITEISPSIERYSEYTPDELIGQPASFFYGDPHERTALMNILMKKGEVADYEIILKTKNNELVNVSLNAHYLFDSDNQHIGIEGSLRDITERKEMEMELVESLEEKEMLLKEIHHRVKNNLMVISSLLNLQSRYIKDKDDLDMFRQSQNRANSMALIHERLYRSTDLKRIDFGEYIETLSSDLYNTYAADPTILKLNVDVENLMLDINTSIPLGLILNELLSNAMKHAFPDKMKGEINVSFYITDDTYVLKISDNGIGLPDDFDIFQSDSLGLKLVTSLTNQIDGNIEINRDGLTEFKITFKEPEYKD
jgi:PAS domain S-box-containing protein